MASQDATWLPLSLAARRAGESYETIRRLAKKGVFTRGVFSAAEKRPPVFLNVKELDAWKNGGVDAVRKVQDRAKRSTKARA